MQNSAPKKIVPTPEQEAIYNIVSGFYLVVANAGSGKTTVCAELFVRLYRREQARLFPGKGNVTGNDQLRILALFLLVSFTKKAAKELDDRIHKLFLEAGIPAPQSRGGPVRICRTMDSMLRDWLRSPMFFTEWTKVYPGLPNTFVRFASILSENLRAEVQDIGGPNKNLALGFFRSWGGTITEERQLAVLDAVMSEVTLLPPLGGASIADLVAGVTAHVRTATTKEDLRQTPPILEQVASEIIAQQKHYHLIERGGHKHVTSEQLQAMKLWQARIDELETFLTVFDFARSRGWSPGDPVKALARTDILDTIANSTLPTLATFMTVAEAYQRAKALMGLMDYGDYLATFVAVIENPGSTFILDRTSEYPRWYIRRKYVIVDENQDYNRPQFTVQKALCAKKGVDYLSIGVGDPFQSLYEFRGSHPMQFIRGIEKLRENKPENLLTLSCCFRSGRRIVDLGNEILRTLSRHGATATPSRGAKPFDGDIIVPRPFTDSIAEASYIMEKATTLASRGETVMILFRANARAHPIARMIDESEVKGISLISVHGSKGLEADHVFVAGLNAGAFPDVRCSFEQEVNCFYVACTRAMQTLTLTCHTTTVHVDKDGSVTQESADPSPFFKMVPTISKLALESGWSAAAVGSGISAHKKAMAIQIEKKESRLHELRKEIEAIAAKEASGPNKIEIADTSATEEAPAYQGARASNFEIKLAPENSTPASPNLVFDQGTFESCRKVFLKGGRPAHLKSAERTKATQAGWLAYRGGEQVFSVTFMELLKR